MKILQNKLKLYLAKLLGILILAVYEINTDQTTRATTNTVMRFVRYSIQWART